MLRGALILFAGALMLLGGYLVLEGPVGPGLNALGFGLLVMVGTLFERWRYRKSALPADTQWQATGERFSDPGTGREVEVFYDPVSGERRYEER
jgi:hypothetical protein